MQAQDVVAAAAAPAVRIDEQVAPAAPASAPAPAAVAASPAAPAPARAAETKRARLPVWQLAVLAVLAAVALVYGAPLVVARCVEWYEAGVGMPPIVHALAEVVPLQECTPVTYDDVRNGTAMGGTVQLRDVAASLRHHMRYTRSQGISAQYLERHRLCYALINMVERADDKPNVVEMFNLHIRGTSARRVRNIEKSVLCRLPYTVPRHQVVVIGYMTRDGEYIQRDVTGLAAQTVQQVVDVQSGKGHCEDSNLEAKMQKLYERLDADDPLYVASLSALGDGGGSVKRLPAS